MKKNDHKWLLIGVAMILTIIFLALLIRDFMPEIKLLLHYNLQNRALLIEMIRSHGLKDMLFLVIVIALLNAIPGASNSVICIFTGLCYGPAIGFLINWMANILGNCSIYALIDHLNFSKHFKENKILDRLMHHEHPLVGLTIGYMVPVIPSILVNYSCTQLKVKRSQFLLMATVGMLPTSFLYAFGGDAIMKGNFKRIIVVAILVGGLICLRQMIVRHRRGKQVG
ncbi:MAG TPA: VTT domain-containing protein [Candidatus Limosilactobacillus faecipullorum]|nr:VTT domain-containing protein [Candidatus Limosilactobacillus faecipullorum]